jgi:hypothetical protein
MARPARRAIRVLRNPFVLTLALEELAQVDPVAVVASDDALTFTRMCSRARKAAEPKGAAY